MIQTCNTWVTWGKAGYPPPGSRLCPAHGSAQSESRGWSYLKNHPGTPLTGIGAATYVSGKRPGKFGPPWGEGGGGPVPCRAGSDGASVATPSQPQLRTPENPPYSAVSPKMLVLSPTYASHTPTPTSCQARDMAGKTYSPSSAYYSCGRTG